MGMRFLDRVFGVLGLRPENLTDKQHRLVRQAEQDVDCSGQPRLQAAQRAQLLWDAGRREEALQMFDVALTHAPADAVLHLNRGNLLFQMGRYEEASAAYQNAQQFDPAMDPVLLANARMLKLLGPNSPALRRLAARRLK